MRYFLLIIFFAAAFAEPHWDISDIRNFDASYRHYREKRFSRIVVPSARSSYPAGMSDGCDFVQRWQLDDSDSSEYGGIIEAETGELRDVIQTDNTQESVIIWSLYKNLFASDRFDSSLALSLDYVARFPAYDEEISEYSFYYPVWNSGLAMLMVMSYFDAYDDSSLFTYGDSCAQFVMDSILPLDTDEPLYNLVHCFVTAFVSGALAEYGEFRGNDTFICDAESLGVRAKIWAETHPDTALGMEVWAMSPGTVIWGLLHSYFAHHPDELPDWISDYIDVYVPEMAPPATEFDPYIWDNAWNIWYANGFRALAQVTADSAWYNKYRNLVDYLLSQDTDFDGGIPASAAHGDTMDMTWVTTYLLFMGIEGAWDSLPEYDAGAMKLEFIGDTLPFYTVEDTMQLLFKFANCGLENILDAEILVACDDDTIYYVNDSLPLGCAVVETILWSPDTSDNRHIALSVNCIGDEFPQNDTLSLDFYITPIRSITGRLVNWASDTIDGKIDFYTFFDSTAPYFSAETDSFTHTFDAALPEILYRLRIEPKFPNPIIWLDSVDISTIGEDWEIVLPVPDILIVEDDGGDYGEYFSAPMESIGVKFALWNRDDGKLASTLVEPFQLRTILWFTGDSEESTLTDADMSFLGEYIDSGGNVILSGQYIAEDIFGSEFWNDYINAALYGSGESVYLHDIFGIHKIVATSGDGSALNQVSLDWMVPPDDAEPWIAKNLLTTDTNIVAFSRNFGGGGKILFSSLGFEGIGKIGTSTLQESRKQLFQKIMDWVDTASIHSEEQWKIPQQISISVSPNPFNSMCKITIFGGDCTPKVLRIFDISGNLLLQQYNHNSNNDMWNVIWQPTQNVSSGIYLVEVLSAEKNGFCKIIHLK